MPSKYVSKFLDSWLTKDTYHQWLVRDADIHSAQCKWCMKSFSVVGQGESALKSHAEGKKYHSFATSTTGMTNLTSWGGVQPPFTSTSTNLNLTSSAEQSKTSIPGIASFVAKEEMLAAEIVWTLHCMDHHHSFVSNSGVNRIFTKMFPDSEIAIRII